MPGVGQLMDSSPYRALEPTQAEAPSSAGSCDRHLYPCVAVAWMACAAHVAGATYAAVVTGAAFGSGPTVALMAVVALPALLLRA